MTPDHKAALKIANTIKNEQTRYTDINEQILLSDAYLDLMKPVDLAGIEARHKFWDSGTPFDHREAYAVAHQDRAELLRLAKQQQVELAQALERVRVLETINKDIPPNAAYECAACGLQWYDGIQANCGNAKNELAYCRPPPCIAALKEPKP